MDPYLAQVIIFAGNFAPLSWAFCHGQLLSIAENTALFSLVGTTYGGDGQVTFAVPDLRSRVAIGTGQGPGRSLYDLGQESGTERVTLLSSNLPQHVHGATATATVHVSSAQPNSDEPDGALLTSTSSAFYTSGAAAGSLGGVSAHVTIQPAGSNQPVGILPPYLAINYIIAVEGIYPSRN